MAVCVLQAPVKMQVTAPANVTVLFNTDAEGSADAGGGMTHYTFKQTPPIATYLIALVVGDLAHEEVLVVRQEGQPALAVRVWARRSAAASLSLAAHAAAAAVQGADVPPTEPSSSTPCAAGACCTSGC